MPSNFDSGDPNLVNVQPLALSSLSHDLPVRQSTRTNRPPIWLQDYVHSAIKCPIFPSEDFTPLPED